MLALFFKSLIIGFAIAAPVGPIGVLCIQRSLHDGFKVGLMTGLGAATADGIYGLIAGFGLTAVSFFLVAQQFWIRLVGGLFLLYLGTKLLLTPYHEKRVKGKAEKSAWHAYASAIFLTLGNPATILSFVAIFAGLGLGSEDRNYGDACILILGITLGSAAWWIFLSGGVAFILHHRINSTSMRVINIISGIVMLGFGIAALSMWNRN